MTGLTLGERLEKHEAEDKRRFDGIEKLFEDGMHSLERKLDDALSGSEDRAGLRERVRVLEKAALDRQWYFRTVWAAIVVEGLVMLFRIFSVKVG